MPSERSPRRSSKVQDKDGDQNRRRRLHNSEPLDALPTSDSKPVAKNSSEISHRKGNGLGESEKIPDPAGVSRSRSYTQHDVRGSTAQDGRCSGRRMTPERWKWKESRDEDRAARRTAGSDPNEKEKPEARGGDSHVWRHDRFSDVDRNADQPAKKRRQFREEKLPPVSEDVVKAVPDPTKDPHALNVTRDASRHGERDRDRRPLERNDYGRAYGRTRSFSNVERLGRADLPSRDRFNGSEYNGRYRGGNSFSGRQGYQSSGGREEKWKHDLFDQTDPTPTNDEEDPVAKVEALLSL